MKETNVEFISSKIEKNVKYEREKGITMIALVITIVVLIILASIGMSMLNRRQFSSWSSWRC